MQQENDPFLWLEDIDSKEALQWVEQKNIISRNDLQHDTRFAQFEQVALQILEDSDKIPSVEIRGGFVYNFWQDADHIRGLWRRTTLKDFQQEHIEWDVLIDIDALAEVEKENWVFKGVRSLPPENTHCLVFLSRGGKDAVVVREFNLETREFIKDGFYVPEAKTGIDWINKNELLVATDFGPDTLTDSGYAAIVKRWKRGQPLEDAQFLYQIDRKEIEIWPCTQFRPEKNYTFICLTKSFFQRKILLLGTTGEFEQVDIPEDAEFHGFWKEHVLVTLRSDWRDAKQGDAIALHFQTNELIVLYHPNENDSVSYITTVHDSIIIGILENVTNLLLEIRLVDSVWIKKILPFDKTSEVYVAATDEFTNNYFVVTTNFLTPRTLYLKTSEADTPLLIKKEHDRFDATGLEVKQHWAVSQDGTRIPYFLVSRPELKKDGGNPTLLHGYGGFKFSMTPIYIPIAGKLWLEQGGVYVLANIRGGGEFGPRWHHAALQMNRHKAFEDFICIAENLIAQKITSPQKLGIMGESNGGLLMGVMLTKRPDLFKAIICAVPLLDMLRYHKLLAGASWIEEYGNPEDDKMREYICSYSPYQNVFPDQSYPQVFFITSTKDDRVHPGHARKMVAKMEKQGHKVYYYENTEGGHSAGANLKQYAKIAALKYMYLHKTLMTKG